MYTSYSVHPIAYTLYTFKYANKCTFLGKEYLQGLTQIQCDLAEIDLPSDNIDTKIQKNIRFETVH